MPCLGCKLQCKSGVLNLLHLCCTRYTLGFHYKGIPYLEPGFATIVPMTAEQEAVKQSKVQPHLGEGEDGRSSSLVSKGSACTGPLAREAAPAIKLRASAAPAQAPVQGCGATSSSSYTRKEGHGKELGADCAKPSTVQHALQLMASILAFVTAQTEPGPVSAGGPLKHRVSFV